MSFTIRYAVPMKGPGCARSVTNKINTLDGVESVEIDLAKQEAVITGKVAPSLIVESMQSIGRDAFIRGSGRPNSAAVAILETPEGNIKGLTRLIEVAHNSILFDVSADSEHAGASVSVHSFGNLSNPPQTLGEKLFSVLKLPSFAGKPSVSSYATVTDTPLSNLIGRSVHTSTGLSGIIARSAGLWENDKTVCACSGKTVWEERKDFQEHTNGHL